MTDIEGQEATAPADLDPVALAAITSRLETEHPNATVTDALIAGYLMGLNDAESEARIADLEESIRRLVAVPTASQRLQIAREALGLGGLDG